MGVRRLVRVLLFGVGVAVRAGVERGSVAVSGAHHVLGDRGARPGHQSGAGVHRHAERARLFRDLRAFGARETPGRVHAKMAAPSGWVPAPGCFGR